MAYSLSATIVLGAGNAGLTLSASLFDSANSAAGGLTTSTLVEVAASTGTYLWTGTVPDGHRGYIRFDSSGTFKAAVSLNAQEVENPDVKTSTRSSHTAADVWAAGTRTLTSFGTLAADVWAVGTRTLTGFGTLVADVATAIWSAVSRTLTSGSAPSAAVVAAAVWDEPRGSHLQLGSFGIADQVVRDGQAQGGSTTTLTLDAGASSVSGFYANDVIFLKVGTGAGQVNIISGYVGATKVATMLVPWTVTPDATSCFVILPLALIPGASNLSAGDIWSYVTRTLTQSIAAVTPPPLLTGDVIQVLRGETISLPFTGLGDLTGRTKLWFTVKGNRAQPDTAAVIQIEETAGLLVLNGQAGTAGQGSLTVLDPNTGAVTALLQAPAAALLVPSDHYYYDIQELSPSGVRTVTGGVFQVMPDTTRSIA